MNFSEPVQEVLDQSIDLMAVESVLSVRGDGNCGFRVVADCIKHDQGSWGQVKEEMLAHFLANETFYLDLFAQDVMLKIQAILSDHSSPCSLDNWFMLPECAMIAASCYNLPIVAYSKCQSITFLPLLSTPSSFKPLIMQLHASHFYRIHLKPGKITQWPQMYPGYTKMCDRLGLIDHTKAFLDANKH